MPQPRADLRQIPHRWEAEVKKIPDKCRGEGGGGVSGLGIDQAIREWFKEV